MQHARAENGSRDECPLLHGNCVDGYGAVCTYMSPPGPPTQLQAAFFSQRSRTAPCEQRTKSPAQLESAPLKMAIVKTPERWKRTSKPRQELMSRAVLEHALLSLGYLHQGSALRLLGLLLDPLENCSEVVPTFGRRKSTGCVHRKRRGGLNPAGPEWVPHPAPRTSQAPFQASPSDSAARSLAEPSSSSSTLKSSSSSCHWLRVLAAHYLNHVPSPRPTRFSVPPSFSRPHASVSGFRAQRRPSAPRASLACRALGFGSSSPPALARGHWERRRSESHPAEARFFASSTAPRA